MEKIVREGCISFINNHVPWGVGSVIPVFRVIFTGMRFVLAGARSILTGTDFVPAETKLVLTGIRSLPLVFDFTGSK